ncbi:hypothetical protein AGMMS50212_16520 [Spirochaetia bacterium]|nr:hypothetical protein AGMMS50212_16520 [Spirochaetia bacterium]
MKRLILNRGEENRIKAGHLWVFDNEVQKVLLSKGDESNLSELEAGETADIESCRKEYLGRAFVNPNSKIIARIYSRSKEGVDTGFFKQRIRRAMEERTSFDLNIESARLVFAEADGLPGLVIDKYTGWSFENIFELDGVCFLHLYLKLIVSFNFA